MSPNLIIGLVLGYLLGMPILLRLIAYAHKKIWIARKLEKAGKSAEALKKVPPELWPKMKERLRFTFKDKRPAQLGKKTLGMDNRTMFFTLYGAGAALFIIGGAIGMRKLLPLGIIMFFVAIIFGYKSPKGLLETREKILKRMYDIGRAKMGLSAEYENNPGAVVKVLEWEDYIKPQKAEYQIPTNFGQEGAEGFLKLFNQNFGGETAWVPSDDPESGTPGWNFQESVVTIHAVPPLPQRANWSEHYVLNPAIAWSFFPIALGVENGVELPNPETGETEYVLGLTFPGSRLTWVKKQGLKSPVPL